MESKGKRQKIFLANSRSRIEIVKLIKEKPVITQNEMALKLELSVKAIEKHIKFLRESNIIRRVGADRGGHWEVIV